MKMIEKSFFFGSQNSFGPRPLIFEFQQESLKFNDIQIQSWSSPKLTW